MKVHDTALPGVRLIEPDVFRDERGFFLEAFNRARFAEHGLPTTFVQDNHSRSREGVLRGLHYQLRKPQGKLVTVLRGRVFDVAVDLRRGSHTFGRWVGVELSGDDPRSLWIPPGFAHGFCALSPEVDFLYKCTELYDAADERGIRWNDPTLDIAWPVARPVVSPRDASLPLIDAARAEPPHEG